MTKQELSNIILASSRLGFNDCYLLLIDFTILSMILKKVRKIKMTIKELSEMGFIYKKLTKHLYLVRLYADKKNPLHKIIIPLFITDKEKE